MACQIILYHNQFELSRKLAGFNEKLKIFPILILASNVYYWYR